MKAMYSDSCLLETSQGFILFQSIAKCCCSLGSDFVKSQAVQVTNYEGNVLVIVAYIKVVKDLFFFSPSPSAAAPWSPIWLRRKLYKSQIMKAMYSDSCLRQFNQGLILLQSIAKCCCSLVSNFVITQAVQVTDYEGNVL